MNNLVEIVNLTKKYGTNVAVNHLTVSLPKGKIQTVDKTLLVSTPKAFFLFWVQKVCT